MDITPNPISQDKSSGLPDYITITVSKNGIEKVSRFDLKHAEYLTVSHEPELKPITAPNIHGAVGYVITKEKVIIDIDYGDGIFP